LGAGQVILLSAVPAVPASLSVSRVVFGSLIHHEDPSYPPEALHEHIQGQVLLQISIGKDGTVKAIKPIRGKPMLCRAAMEAVRQWSFTPSRVNGAPVDGSIQITFEFKLAN